MKILLLSVMYPSERFPSFGTFVKNWEDGMLAEGMDIVREVIDQRRRGIRKVWEYCSYCLRAARAALRRDIDVVYVHFATLSLFPLIFVAPFLRRPLVVNAHGTDILSSHWLSRCILRCNRILLQRAKVIVVPSAYLRGEVHSRFPDTRVFVSPSSGVNGRHFRPAEVISEDDQQLKLGFASRLLESKGWGDFLAALETLKKARPDLDITAVIAGTGPDAVAVEALLANPSSDVVVNYVGELDQQQLGEFYRGLSLFVFPSRMPESLGLVALEAMACGVPVIGSEVGAIPALVRPGVTGFLFPPGSPETISHCVEEYLALSLAARMVMRDNCLRLAEEYRGDHVSRELARELRAIVGRPGE